VARVLAGIVSQAPRRTGGKIGASRWGRRSSRIEHGATRLERFDRLRTGRDRPRPDARATPRRSEGVLVAEHEPRGLGTGAFRVRPRLFGRADPTVSSSNFASPRRCGVSAGGQGARSNRGAPGRPETIRPDLDLRSIPRVQSQFHASRGPDRQEGTCEPDRTLPACVKVIRRCVYQRKRERERSARRDPRSTPAQSRSGLSNRRRKQSGGNRLREAVRIASSEARRARGPRRSRGKPFEHRPVLRNGTPARSTRFDLGNRGRFRRSPRKDLAEAETKRRA
jgi:hypothetical protein